MFSVRPFECVRMLHGWLPWERTHRSRFNWLLTALDTLGSPPQNVDYNDVVVVLLPIEFAQPDVIWHRAVRLGMAGCLPTLSIRPAKHQLSEELEESF